MKKVIAGILAVTAVLCAFTGCRKETYDDVKDDKTAETTISEEETTAEEETTETVSEADSSDASYEDVIYEFIDAYNALDYQKTLEMQMPDGIMKAIDFSVKYDEKEKRDTDEIIREFQRVIYGNVNDEHIKVSIKNIIDKETMTDKELLDLKFSFGMYEWIIKFVNENETNPDYDDSMFEEAMSKLDTNDFLEQANITDGYRVTMELENEKTGNTYEGNIYVINYKGKWKINAEHFLGSDMTQSLKPLEEFARNICIAQRVAIAEMEEEDLGVNWESCFIVCSDESKDYNVPYEFERDLFINKTRQYFEAIDKTEWFSIIHNGVVHTVAYVKDKPETIETHPDFKYDNGEVISVIGEKLSDDMSFDEMYAICVKAVDNK
jgi:hypothetical protein